MLWPLGMVKVIGEPLVKSPLAGLKVSVWVASGPAE